MAEIDRERTRRARRRRLAVTVLVPAAVLLVGATSYALLRGDQVVSAGIGCYDSPGLDGNVAVISSTGEDPVAACAELWSAGGVKAGATEVPPLVACVNEGGAVVVLPGRGASVCSDLGWQPVPDDYEAAAGRFVAMRDDFVGRLVSAATAGGRTERDACLDEETALRIGRRTLQDHGFTDWTVRVATGDYRGRSCANLHGFDDTAKELLIVPSDPGIDPNPYGPH